MTAYGEYLELIDCYLEGSLPMEDEVRLFEAVGQDPELARHFAEQVQEVELLLHALVQSKDVVTVRKHAGKRIRKPSKTRIRAKWRASAWPLAIWASIAACILIVLGAHYINKWQKTPTPYLVIARIESVSGSAYVKRNDEKFLIEADTEIASEDTILVPENGSVVVRYRGGTTTISVASRTEVKLWVEERAKKGKLFKGELKCNVDVQSVPMVLLTDHAEVVVWGTVFGLSTNAGGTRLDVMEGRVRLKRLADETIVEVVEGQYAVVESMGTGITVARIWNSEVHAKSGSAEDIQAAVDEVAKTGGGTVYIPKGNFRFDKTVSMPGGINIIGAGEGRTVLNLKTDRGFTINKDGDKGDAFRISGITFKEVSIAVRLYNIEDFRIDHCAFHAGSDKPSMISIPHKHGYPRSRGVIDHCSFYCAGKGYGVHVNPQPWPENENGIKYLGSAWNIFIEDCHFEEPLYAASAFNGGHFVFRYNTVLNPLRGVVAQRPGGEYVVGEPEPKQYRGGRCVEIYNNTFATETGIYTEAPIKLNSGSGVIFNNKISNSNSAILLTLEDGAYGATGGRYPALDQVHDTWIWNNTTKAVKQGLIGLFGQHAAEFIRKDRDYFLRKPTKELDGFDYKPYTYPHPLTLVKEKEKVSQ